MFCVLLVLVQLVLVVVWIALDTPRVDDVYSVERHVQVCSLNARHVALASVYNVILGIVATLYSFLTRNVDENFAESKWISYAMYSVCVSWIIDGVVLVFRTQEEQGSKSRLEHDPEKNWALSCMANSGVATLIVTFLFAHRVYKIFEVLYIHTWAC